MLPLELTATPVTSPRYKSFGILSGLTPSNAMSGAACCAQTCVLKSTSNATTIRDMTSSMMNELAVRTGNGALIDRSAL